MGNPLTVALLALLLSHSTGAAKGPKAKLDTLVTFGDSYTDIVSVGDGGTAWPVYAAGYANATLYPFAKSGAVCDQNLTPRPYPGVVQDEIPAYIAGIKNKTVSLHAEKTLHTLWIGTNDLGPTTLLTGQDITSNASIATVTACAVAWAQTLYRSGARVLLYQNLIPLDRTILYSADGYPNRFWTSSKNSTEWALYMRELVTGGNKISELMLQALASSLPGAHIGLFDSHALFTDILDNPGTYLNGTAAYNTTGCVNSCVYQVDKGDETPVCTVATGSDRDSFVWQDELHPSEQSDRIVALEIANVMEGKGSKWATWFS